MILTAKPITRDYWVITDGNSKIGNVQAATNGYELRIGGRTIDMFSSTEEIARRASIRFEEGPVKPACSLKLAYPTGDNPVYNQMVDLRRNKLPIFTKEPDSRCYYAAGWFAINYDGAWTVEFCPKYLYIQRYQYAGPFMTEEEAVSAHDARKTVC